MRGFGFGLLLVLTTFQGWAQAQRTTIAIDKKDHLTFERAPFSADGKTFKTINSPHDGQTILVAINDKQPFGTDGEMPKYTLSKATVLFKGHVYHLPVSGMYNPWFGDKLDQQFVHLTKVGSALTIRAVFADGAGSYLAEWKISGNSAKRTLLTSDDALVTGFFQPNPSGK
ncbi:hypothetical protein [Hymenobacter convexus]|uniref:hypothetical protein n=1 Tax=Hymenobacter sp. CA1UV-4 TaxID=3063782 RepID=UPI002712B61D|nr:hypothetical protein [Hymenobacter sp. CA1UV-4]MDO7852199.1 hypothetical protein [Hymenobacter sp. CA1UV-4]